MWTRPDVSGKLSELLGFLAEDKYSFEFRSLTGDRERETYLEIDEGRPWFEPDSVILFSGGLDSLTGVVRELKETDRKLLLVSHRPVSTIDKPQRDLVFALKDRFDAHQRLLHIPVWVNKEKGITKDANQRSRSFLYASLATVIATMTGTHEIKFYEDKLDGVIDDRLWRDVTTKWRTEQDRLSARLERLKQTDRNYIEQAVKILELSKMAHSLYLNRMVAEKRQLLRSVLSNCSFDGLTLYPTYNKPFNHIAEGRQNQIKLPRLDEIRNSLLDPSTRLLTDQLTELYNFAEIV